MHRIPVNVTAFTQRSRNLYTFCATFTQPSRHSKPINRIVESAAVNDVWQGGQYLAAMISG